MPDVRGDYRRCLQSDGGVRMGDIPSLMQGYGQVSVIAMTGVCFIL
jgi:hypothetical protein